MTDSSANQVVEGTALGAIRGQVASPTADERPTAKGKEKLLVNKILKYLRARGCFAEKLHGGQYQRIGLHDIVCCYRGRFVTFEAKAGSEAPSEAQLAVGREIEQAGGVWYTVYRLYEVTLALEIIDTIVDGR